MAEGNSYTNLLKMMKQQGYNKDIRVAIGKVVSPTPLVINMGKYNIDEDDMFISETIDKLITGFVGEIKDYASPHPHSKDVVLPDDKKLKAGDKVLILVDESDFYVIDRVV